MCKRRFAETSHLTIKSTGKLARLLVGTGSDFYETVKKRNVCLKSAIYCQLIELWARSVMKISLWPKVCRHLRTVLAIVVTLSSQKQSKFWTGTTIVNLLLELFVFWTLNYILIINTDKFQLPVTNTIMNNFNNFLGAYLTRRAKLSMCQCCVAISLPRVQTVHTSTY